MPIILFQRSMTRLLIVCAVLGALLGLTVPAAAKDKGPDPTPATLNFGVFARNLPMLVADAKGFYAEQALTVNYLQIQSSTQQFQALRDGQYDITNAAFDNVANYRLNPNNALGAPQDVLAFAGTDYGLKIVLATRKGITSPSELRGKVVSVDARGSGFALILYKILRGYGLERDRDYTVIETGGVFNRFQGLIAGQFDGTLLSGGFETRAANMGYPLFETVQDIADPYFAGAVAAKSTWLKKNHDVAVRFTAAYVKAVNWTFDPANREEAIALLMAQPNTTRALAEQLYAIQVDPSMGNIPGAEFNREGIYNNLALRQEFGGFEQPQNIHKLSKEQGGLYTDEILKDARKLLKKG